MDFPGGSECKDSPHNAGDPGSITGSKRISWTREWLPTLVFLPKEPWTEELVGYRPWNSKESDITKHLTLSYVHFIYINKKLKIKLLAYTCY